MKNNNLTLLGFVTIVFLLASCDGGTSVSDTYHNKYLGKLPGIDKKYTEKIDKKKKDLKECTDFEKSFKLSKELELLKEERKTKIEEYVSANPLTKPLPFEPLSVTVYTIKDVTINKVSAGNLNIKFSLTINEDIKNKWGGIEKILFIYYKGIDSKGNEIQNSKTVATNFKRQDLKAGIEYEAFGSWQTKAIINMEDFAKVVEITRKEYEKK